MPAIPSSSTSGLHKQSQITRGEEMTEKATKIRHVKIMAPRLEQMSANRKRA